MPEIVERRGQEGCRTSTRRGLHNIYLYIGYIFIKLFFLIYNGLCARNSETFFSYHNLNAAKNTLLHKVCKKIHFENTVKKW